mmetsp:Transcript_3928/g.9925  ORF Transcript_3928/g.9925 Transcript_3928/m.9925 type:complete len:591 (+) Transcript_3928:2976-4748(+)
MKETNKTPQRPTNTRRSLHTASIHPFIHPSGVAKCRPLPSELPGHLVLEAQLHRLHTHGVAGQGRIRHEHRRGAPLRPHPVGREEDGLGGYAAEPLAALELLPLHHQRHGGQVGAVSHVGCVEDDGACADCAPAAYGDGAHLHDAVLKQVALHSDIVVDAGVIANRHQVRLGQVRRRHVHPAANPRTQQMEPHGQQGSADQHPDEAVEGQVFLQRIGELGAPDERRPEGRLLLAVPAHQQPLAGDGDYGVDGAVQPEHGRHEEEAPPAEIGQSDGPHIPCKQKRVDRHDPRQYGPQRLNRPPYRVQVHRGVEGAAVPAVLDHGTVGEREGQRPQPRRPILGLVRTGGKGHHPQQRLLAEAAAPRHTGVVPEECPLLTHHLADAEVALGVDGPAPQADEVCHEAVVTDVQHIGGPVAGVGDLHTAPELGAKKVEVGPGEHGGVELVGECESDLLSPVVDPPPQVEPPVQRVGALLDALHRHPLEHHREQQVPQQPAHHQHRRPRSSHREPLIGRHTHGLGRCPEPGHQGHPKGEEDHVVAEEHAKAEHGEGGGAHTSVLDPVVLDVDGDGEVPLWRADVGSIAVVVGLLDG